jgi:tetratricopeptide (TPR) repeat protein
LLEETRKIEAMLGIADTICDADAIADRPQPDAMVLDEAARRLVALQTRCGGNPEMLRRWVRIADRLANLDPERFREAFANAVQVLGDHLTEHGPRRRAAGPLTDALELYRDLAATDPARFSAGLLASLEKLAAYHQAMDQRADAVPLLEEAVVLRQGTLLPIDEAALAATLDRLASCLPPTGQVQRLTVCAAIVAIRRRLAARQPDAFLPLLARSLATLASCYQEACRPESALEVCQEQMLILRGLAQSDPAHRPALANALSDLAVLLDAQDQLDGAVAALLEAVAIDRQRPRSTPLEILDPQLERLQAASQLLARAGRRAQALAIAEELVAEMRRGESYEVEWAILAARIADLSDRYAEMGMPIQALAAMHEASRIGALLAAEREALEFSNLTWLPSQTALLAPLVLYLAKLCERQADLGLHVKATISAVRALSVADQLAEVAPPGQYVGERAYVLLALARCHDRIGETDAARVAREEVVRILTPLVGAGPDEVTSLLEAARRGLV